MSDASPSGFLLLGREQCCLCEQAELLLEELGFGGQYQQLDIDSDLTLIRRFGEQVPVLATMDFESCLSWPFSREQIDKFINQQ